MQNKYICVKDCVAKSVGVKGIARRTFRKGYEVTLSRTSMKGSLFYADGLPYRMKRHKFNKCFKKPRELKE